MCKNTFDYYPHALEYVPDCYMTEESIKKVLILILLHRYMSLTNFKTCEKAVDTCSFMLECIPNCYKNQEMCEKAVSKELFMFKYCLDRVSRNM